ncbi:hypothetical protein KR026_011018 [Drosophila bipectinata]|nr:hypothetical protein KR026_011018 [Drosophila bipectinata]
MPRWQFQLRLWPPFLTKTEQPSQTRATHSPPDTCTGARARVVLRWHLGPGFLANSTSSTSSSNNNPSSDEAEAFVFVSHQKQKQHQQQHQQQQQLKTPPRAAIKSLLCARVSTFLSCPFLRPRPCATPTAKTTKTSPVGTQLSPIQGNLKATTATIGQSDRNSNDNRAKIKLKYLKSCNN